MTIGEKIQFYRKKNGLSQEELGKQLLVSRQTISLWEMDKTLPTIDNFMRLKELFSVSMDELMSQSEPVEEITSQPNEAYTFQYEEADMRAVFKQTWRMLFKRAVRFILICMLLFVFFAAADAPDLLFGVLLGYVLISTISYIKGYFAYKKVWFGSQSKVLQSAYSFEVFNGYMMLRILRNGEITRTQKLFFDDIEKMDAFGNYLILQIGGQSYI